MTSYNADMTIPNGSPEDSSEGPINSDFSFSQDYKPEPLLQQGTYKGNVIKVAYNPKNYVLTWTVCLDNNGGLMTDGQTMVDGSHIYHRVFLPKPEDKNLRNERGQNKFDNKVRMLKRFFDGMHITVDNPREIQTHIDNSDWLGLEVSVEVGISEYQGQIRNESKSMKASSPTTKSPNDPF